MKSLKKLFATTAIAGVTIFVSTVTTAGSIAIVKGSFYTPNLYNNLLAAGQTVTEVTSYTAASLAGYDAVIHYGNTYTDLTELETYVSGGGNLVLTPWAGLNFSVTPNLQIFDNGGSGEHSISYPGVAVLNAADPLLAGVNFPVGTGGFNVGRINNIHFASGVTQVANWLDGVGLIGYKGLGLGTITGINMQVITSDTAYQVIDQQWAIDLISNAAGGVTANNVPEPANLILLSFGLVGIRLVRNHKAILTGNALA